jgi:hypothetical protein
MGLFGNSGSGGGGVPIGSHPCSGGGCNNGQVQVWGQPRGTTENCSRCGGTGLE